jgi:hypothetical protein
MQSSGYYDVFVRDLLQFVHEQGLSRLARRRRKEYDSKLYGSH